MTYTISPVVSVLALLLVGARTGHEQADGERDQRKGEGEVCGDGGGDHAAATPKARGTE